MKRLLLFLAFCLILVQVKESVAQGSPCPCDCDDILYSPTGSQNNYLHLVRAIGDHNCYTLEMRLNACGGRTLYGFSISMPEPNCFEGKRIHD